MRKKGQGLSITTIIVAAIALIVLVVLVAIFTGRLGSFSKGLSETTDCNQICLARGHDNGGVAGGGDKGEESPGGDTKPLLAARNADGKQCYCYP